MVKGKKKEKNYSSWNHDSTFTANSSSMPYCPAFWSFFEVLTLNFEKASSAAGDKAPAV